ncbi:MAG: hypothetical protein EKK43_11490 [Methylobacterium sp.]|nr:MAG: hypothetical protein EKK43_11490 [Methylobacterium sp.]
MRPRSRATRGRSRSRPHPEVPEHSGGLEGGLQASRFGLEGSFETALPHLRMRARVGGAQSNRL